MLRSSRGLYLVASDTRVGTDATSDVVVEVSAVVATQHNVAGHCAESCKILIFPAEFLVILAIHRRSVVLSWGRYRCLSDGAYNASLLYPLRTFIVGAFFFFS